MGLQFSAEESGRVDPLSWVAYLLRLISEPQVQ